VLPALGPSGWRFSGRWATFLKFWNLKESCAKALGLGASLDFSKLEVTLDPPHIFNPPGLLGPSDTFFVENRSIIIDRRPFCLSIANITGASKEVSFSYQTIH
jgi:phosphopantetheinyl transferase